MDGKRRRRCPAAKAVARAVVVTRRVRGLDRECINHAGRLNGSAPTRGSANALIWISPARPTPSAAAARAAASAASR